jgi:uncharacterized membrane protein YdjX (TVP38/TMEM64 family)
MANLVSRHGRWIGLALVLIALIVASSLLPLREWIGALVQWVEQFGSWAIFAFIGIYALAAVLFVPGSLLTIAAGLVFGLGLGTVAASAGATLGASLAFLIGRYFARGIVEEKTHGSDKFRTIDDAIGREGWKIVGLLRLSPLIPFSASNYFTGLQRLAFGRMCSPAGLACSLAPCSMSTWVQRGKQD